MSWFPCPYLKCEVELTEEREIHIEQRHPDLLPEHRKRIAETLAGPDRIRKSSLLGNAAIFSKWHTDLRRGKHVVVVVVLSEPGPDERPWIITPYAARKLSGGIVIWEQS